MRSRHVEASPVCKGISWRKSSEVACFTYKIEQKPQCVKKEEADGSPALRKRNTASGPRRKLVVIMRRKYGLRLEPARIQASMDSGEPQAAQ